MSTQLTPEIVANMAASLHNYPPNGKPDMSVLANARLVEFGLIEETHTNKTCSGCGTQRPDHYWHKITPAGRVLMAATKGRK